jgi:Putative beta barrel porin-7 (BBP7)
MRKGFLGSMTALLAGTGLALAQSPGASPRPTVPMTPAVLAAGQATPSGWSVPSAQLAQPTITTPMVTTPTVTTPMATTPTVTPPTTPPGMPLTCGSSDCCAPACCDPTALGLQGRFYGDADYLLWWAKGNKLPPLVTTGSVTDLRSTAALGQMNTLILFGNREYDDDTRSGGRFTAGYWLNPEQSVGVEATFLFVEPQSTSFAAASSSGTVLARPFINSDLISGTPTGLSASPENSFLVAFPGINSPAGTLNQLAGTINVQTRNELWGAELNGRLGIAGNCWYRGDLLLGFRYAEVKDNLDITSTSQTTPASPLTVLNFSRTNFAAPFTLQVSDSFRTRNEFYGGQVGANIEVHRGNLFADFRAKLALGVVHQTVDISGQSVLTQGTMRNVSPGGLLALTSNIGEHSRDEFGIVPEVGANVGYQFGRHVRASVGYSILYFRSDVQRTGAIIDRIVNPSLAPALTGIGLGTPVQRPLFGFVDRDFWAQGVNAALEFSF